jgi:hypothetical protein
MFTLRNKEMKKWIPVILIILVTWGVAFGGTFTSYNDITDLATGDHFLVYDASEGSGDQLANISWSNLMSDLISDSSLVAEGTASGGILLGDATPNAAGEFGYDATNEFGFFGANSEDLYLQFPAADTAEIDTGTGVATFRFDAMDLYMIDANNDGNPVFRMGSDSGTEDFTITTTYEAGGQLIESITFATLTADADANDGEFIFSVDGATIGNIDDDGIDLASGKTYSINGSQIATTDLSDGTAIDPDYLNNDAGDNDLIDHEIGGLELNVSAYSGLVAIASGTTSEVDEKSELEAQIGDVADFAEADGDAWSGAHDMGSATSLEIPNAQNPAVGTEGMVAYDTNAGGEGSDEAIIAGDGSNEWLVGKKIECMSFTLIEPDGYDAADLIPVWTNTSGYTFTITEWLAWSDDDDVSLEIEELTSFTDFSSPTQVDAVEIADNGTSNFYASDTTITHAAIEKDHLIAIDFDTTDTPDYVHITICGWFNADVN